MSNALADPSGELFTLPATKSTIASSTIPPAAPDVVPDTTVTNLDAVDIDGTAPGAIFVEVAGPAIGTPGTPNTLYFPLKNGAFEGSVPLGRNLVNHLFFTSISRCGLRSAPRAIAVTQDSAPPKLFIDFPPDGAELTLDAIDVAGRVGDLHSGALGFTVTVNGQAAEVDTGLGTNGTFLARAVPLLSDGLTVIEAVVTDAFGHSTTKSITVSRITPSPGEPQLAVVSGNGQSGVVNTDLAEPVVVRLVSQQGMPFANKLVQFDIIRSDGQLRGTDPVFDCRLIDPVSPLKVQCRTDGNGEVRGTWTLGSDAGCGSNRIEVTSRDVQGSTFFCASSTPAPARQINVSFGNSQSAFNNGMRVEVGQPACAPLRVFVNDGGNGVAGVPVTFTVTQGGGSLNGEGTTGTSAITHTDATGHAEANFTLGPEPGNQRVSATFEGNPGLPAEFVLYGVERQAERPTSFSGLVLSNANEPIQGCECRLTINGLVLAETVSDLDGRFRFDDIPDGPGHLRVDGLTAFHVGGDQGQDVPPRSYPVLAYDVLVIPNAENSLPTPVLLPPLDPCNAVAYDGTQDVRLTVKAANPTTGECEVVIEGFEMLVKAGSMRRADGSVPSPADPAILSLNQVHFDNIPMPMPDGAAPLIAWTLQAGGAHFDPPVQTTYPNTDGLPPGAVQYFLSSDHDTNRFEPVATGYVVENGSAILSDSGTGIDKAGWGGRCNPTPTGSCKDPCERNPDARQLRSSMLASFSAARSLANDARRAAGDAVGFVLDAMSASAAFHFHLVGVVAFRCGRCRATFEPSACAACVAAIPRLVEFWLEGFNAAVSALLSLLNANQHLGDAILHFQNGKDEMVQLLTTGSGKY